MDLSPTDLMLVPFDLYKTDEKYDFKLTDILRRRRRPIFFILDQNSELAYSCRPDDDAPTDRLAPLITPELIAHALEEVKRLINSGQDAVSDVMRQVIINKPGEKCALIVMEDQFWCLRIFRLDGASLDADFKFAALVDPIGNPQSDGLDLNKIKGLFRLSKRESEVVQELVSGGTDKQIAKQLGISVETVRAYLKSVRAKLGVSTRTAIVSVVHNLRDGELASH
ncbi:MAG: helix-turn-helix transcriptional regulator [Gammaproteobacteria bacterium]|nr:helix-turn-helix transcriptional regulator [Gammaproteobacteria bacterium]